jgi:hypothetical protein
MDLMPAHFQHYNSDMENSDMENTEHMPSPPIPTEPSLTDVLSSYSQAGFNSDAFAQADGMILCGSCQSSLAPGHIDVHSIRRLEGTSDPADNVGVVAIICPVCQAKATMVLKYGPEASPDEVTIWQETNDCRTSATLPPDMAPGEDSSEVRSPAPRTSAHQATLPPPVEFE